MKITQDQQAKLAHYAKTIEMAEPLYLRKKTNENFKFIAKKILGVSADNTKVDGVDIAQLITESGLYSAIATSYVDSVGSVPEIDDNDMSRFVSSLIATGRAGWRVNSKDGKEKKLVAISASSFFSTFIDGEEIYTEFVLYKSKQETYVFTRTFYPGRNENKLYLAQGVNLEGAKEVALSKIPETAIFEPIEQTNMSIPAFLCISSEERIFESIQTLVDSIDRRLTEIELEFHKHLDASVIYKNITIPESAKDPTTGKLLKEKMGKSFFATDPEADIVYITNNNPMIDKAVDFIDRDIRRISALSKVPLDYLGVETSDGAIGAESRNAKNAKFFAKVEKIRSAISQAYSDLISGTLSFGPIIGYLEVTNSTNGNNIDSRATGSDQNASNQ